MKIGNPRNIPKGIRILFTTINDKEWYEGDTWVKPTKMPKEEELTLIEKGFLVADDG